MIIETVDLLHLVQRHSALKRVAGTEGGEYHGPCPRCGGVDRFTVQPHRQRPRWACRQCHPSWEDAIEFVRWLEDCTFATAIEKLHLDPMTPRPPRQPVYTDRVKQYPSLADPQYQAAATDFEMTCQARLWHDDSRKVVDFLQRRGLTDRVMRAASLGYNDLERRTEWGDTEVWLPRAITIPWTYEGKLWRMSMRRPRPATPKYISAKGGANGLYGAAFIRPEYTVVMFEGELDALCFRSQLPDYSKMRVVPVAIGTNTGARLPRWVSLLSLAKHVLLAFDTDGAGAQAATYWQGKLKHKAIRWAPTAHDFTDMYLAGHDLEAWLNAGVNEHLERGA